MSTQTAPVLLSHGDTIQFYGEIYVIGFRYNTNGEPHYFTLQDVNNNQIAEMHWEGRVTQEDVLNLVFCNEMQTREPEIC